ncbi:unnamed protein product [Ixodes pacificus]
MAVICLFRQIMRCNCDLQVVSVKPLGSIRLKPCTVFETNRPQSITRRHFNPRISSSSLKEQAANFLVPPVLKNTCSPVQRTCKIHKKMCLKKAADSSELQCFWKTVIFILKARPQKQNTCI